MITTQKSPKHPRSNQVQTHAAKLKPQDTAIVSIQRTRAKIPLPPLPGDPGALARKQQVMEFSGMSNTRLYDLIKAGKMPGPIKIGRSSFWRVGAVREAVKKLSEVA